MGTQKQAYRVGSGAETERRRSHRVEVLDPILGHISPLDVPITLLNLSRDGFLVQSPVNYPVGETRDFRFTMAGRDPIVVRARTVHGMRETAHEGASYVIGLAFADRGVAVNEQAIASLAGFLPPGWAR